MAKDHVHAPQYFQTRQLDSPPHTNTWRHGAFGCAPCLNQRHFSTVARRAHHLIRQERHGLRHLEYGALRQRWKAWWRLGIYGVNAPRQ
jgi:hypothetical protein